MNNYKLFLITLGGKIKNSHIENHDIRWVVGRKIEDTYSELRKEWPGIQQGLHMDSYMEVKYIDGYKIVPKKYLVNDKGSLNYYTQELKTTKLWFIYLGGYNKSCMNEVHDFTLLVSDNKYDAIKRAKNLLLTSSESLHLDNCYSIKNTNGFTIELVKELTYKNQIIKPDWVGYKRINNSKQLKFI